MADGSSQAEVVAFLSDPSTHGGVTPERVETHGSLVFLLPDKVYKLKRAVRYSFLDFSTPERRRRVCQEEVRLNRRTAPDLYLGIQPILRRGAGLTFGAMDSDPDGTLDTVTVMRRFPGTLADELPSDAELAELARVVAEFHEAEPLVPGAQGTAPMREVQEGNLADLAGKPTADQDTVVRLASLARPTLDRLAPMLEARAAGGAVRHCHGDLHLGNVCRWHNRMTLFDCIEFDPSFAEIDTLYDLAFLLVDLDAKDRRDGAALILNRYLEARPEETAALGLLPLFLSVRAQVRAKVEFAAAALKSGEVAVGKCAVAADSLCRAVDYLTPERPKLIAIGGPSGSGKSTLARVLSPHLGAVPGAMVARSDVVRKRLFAAKRKTGRLPPIAYTEDAHERTYDEMERLCTVALGQGHVAIADATFLNSGRRSRIAAVAEAAGVPFVGLWLEIGKQDAKHRVAARGADASDATAAVVDLQFAKDWGTVRWNRIDAALSFADQKDAALAFLS